MRCIRPNVRGAVSRRWPEGVAVAPAADRSASSSSASSRRVLSRKRWPASVRLTLRVVRLRSRAPRRASSAATARVTAGGDRPSRRPARGEASGLGHRGEDLHGVQPVHAPFRVQGMIAELGHSGRWRNSHLQAAGKAAVGSPAMGHRFAELAFTARVKAAQERAGEPGRLRPVRGRRDRIMTGSGRAEAEFLAARDSFYMATVGETGWPYVQHRGGPKGFVRVLDERTIGFADFRGNRQYVSVGNLSGDDRVSLILVDYPNRRRLKILGRARAIAAEDDPATIERLVCPATAPRSSAGWSSRWRRSTGTARSTSRRASPRRRSQRRWRRSTPASPSSRRSWREHDCLPSRAEPKVPQPVATAVPGTGRP